MTNRPMRVGIILGVRLIAALCLAGGDSAAQGRTKSSAWRDVAPEGEKPRKPKTPLQVSRELAARLHKGKMPWQFYQHYTQTYYRFADQVLAQIPKKPSAAQKKQVQKLITIVKYYRGIGDVLTEMAAQRKIMDGIRTGNTDVPPLEKSARFKAAAARHQGLFGELIHMLKNPPVKAAMS